MKPRGMPSARNGHSSVKHPLLDRWRHLVASVNLVRNSFLSVVHLQNNKYTKAGLLSFGAGFSVLLGVL